MVLLEVYRSVEGSLHDVYSTLHSHYKPTELSCSVAFFLVCFVYVAASMPYVIIEWIRLPFFEQYKIQPDRRVTSAEIWRCIGVLIANHVFLALPLMWVSYPILELRGIRFDTDPLPELWVIAAQVLFNFFIEDIWFYFGHRWLHTPFMYKYVHSFHHKFHTPIGMASSFAHPVEFLYLGIGSFLGPLILGEHFLTILVWSVWRQYEAIECHCGYNFPWHLSNWIPLYCGPDHHDYHHFSYSGNFASTFMYMDRLLGTDIKYQDFKSTGGHARRIQKQADRAQSKSHDQ